MLAKLQRDRAVLSNAFDTQDNIKIADAIFNFVITGLSIREWLIEQHFDNKTWKDKVRDYYKTNKMLRLCTDLANGSKHKIRRQSLAEQENPIKNVAEIETMTNSLDIMTNDLNIKTNYEHTTIIEQRDCSKTLVSSFADTVLNRLTSFINTTKHEFS